MTTTPEGPAAVPRSLFQVTHYLRPAQAGFGWAQSQSAELSSEDAAAWIDHQALEAADLGFADGPTADPPVPTAASSVTPQDTLTGAAQASDLPGPALGDA